MSDVDSRVPTQPDETLRAETDLPVSLRDIMAEADAYRRTAVDRRATTTRWKEQAETVRRAVPSAQVRDDGATVFTGKLSAGCEACKAGKWDCVFATTRCNLDCAFCLRPSQPTMPPMYSALGSDPEEILKRYRATGITGVGFSGGEPFLHPEAVEERTRRLRQTLPDLYIWAYTNGLILTPERLKRVADAGLNELRFNMAATGYLNPSVLDMVKKAVRIVPAVTVEVPAIPAHSRILLEAMATWAEAGVRHLNLHELIYQDGTNSGAMRGQRMAYTMPDGHPCFTDPGSMDLITSAMENARGENMPLSVNACMIQSKSLQMRGRRRLLEPFVLRPYERMREDGMAESICVVKGRDLEFMHPESWTAGRAGQRALAVRRLLPMDLQNPGRWVDYEWMTGGGAPSAW